MPAQDAGSRDRRMQLVLAVPDARAHRCALLLLIAGALVPRWPRGGSRSWTACAARCGGRARWGSLLWDERHGESARRRTPRVRTSVVAMFVTITIRGCCSSPWSSTTTCDGKASTDRSCPVAGMVVACRRRASSWVRPTTSSCCSSARDVVRWRFYVPGRELSPQDRQLESGSSNLRARWVLSAFLPLSASPCIYCGAVGSTNITDVVATLSHTASGRPQRMPLSSPARTDAGRPRVQDRRRAVPRVDGPTWTRVVSRRPVTTLMASVGRVASRPPGCAS